MGLYEAFRRLMYRNHRQVLRSLEDFLKEIVRALNGRNDDPHQVAVAPTER
jgi:hypothetical protein